MLPPAFHLAPLPSVTPAPLPALVAGISPRGSKSFHHVAGTARGGRVVLDDLNACAWYAGGGFDTRGARTLTSGRGLRGVEDNEKRKQ